MYSNQVSRGGKQRVQLMTSLFSATADELTSPVSAILTQAVVDAYGKIAGDFHVVVPFALLEARRRFRNAARVDPSDSGENTCRQLACEALARKMIASTPLLEQYHLLSARFTVLESDGEQSLPRSGTMGWAALGRGWQADGLWCSPQLLSQLWISRRHFSCLQTSHNDACLHSGEVCSCKLRRKTAGLSTCP